MINAASVAVEGRERNDVPVSPFTICIDPKKEVIEGHAWFINKYLEGGRGKRAGWKVVL